MAAGCSAAHPVRFTVHSLEGFLNLPPSGSFAHASQEVSLGAAFLQSFFEKKLYKNATPKKTSLPSLRSKRGRYLWYWLRQIRECGRNKWAF